MSWAPGWGRSRRTITRIPAAATATPGWQTIRTGAAQAFQTYTGLLESLEEDGLLGIDERRVRDLRQGFGQLVQTDDLEREYLQEMIDLFPTRVSTELNPGHRIRTSVRARRRVRSPRPSPTRSDTGPVGSCCTRAPGACRSTPSRGTG